MSDCICMTDFSMLAINIHMSILCCSLCLKKSIGILVLWSVYEKIKFDVLFVRPLIPMF